MDELKKSVKDQISKEAIRTATKFNSEKDKDKKAELGVAASLLAVASSSSNDNLASQLLAQIKKINSK